MMSAPLGANLTSPKRGLVYTGHIPSGGYSVWDSSKSDLTWYYNYASSPSYGFSSSNFEFVPMLWGVGGQYTGFYDTVKGLIDGGTNINYILGFNEPDLCTVASAGGSCISATKAAQVWQTEIEPLKDHGVLLGAPATTQGGLWWLQDFFTACAGKCTVDFLPLHFYGDFASLAGYIGLLRTTYPNKPLWITEFAYPNATLPEAKLFFNQSVSYLDSLSYLERYAYFGSFPADEASTWVGPNGTMLNNAGELTDIGAWYLGENATGKSPESMAHSLAPKWYTVFSAFMLLMVVASWG